MYEDTVSNYFRFELYSEEISIGYAVQELLYQVIHKNLFVYALELALFRYDMINFFLITYQTEKNFI